MRFARVLLLPVILGSAFLCSQSGTAQMDFSLQAQSVVQAAPDPVIANVLKSIQPAHVEQTIRSLVSFGTRNTLSSMETNLPAGQGINAAADWVSAQFEQISKQCGSCLQIHRDAFTEQSMDRIPRPTTITNIYAVLPGSDTVQAKRMYMVVGHYDSRNTDVLDTRGAAPGANDDASGTAVVLECARALSQMRFSATIVFAVVAGEEQGLNGSRHLAKLAHDEGWQLEAVLNNDIIGGNTTPGDSLQLKDRVRVFSEGLPTTATPEQVRRIRAIGGEEDSSSRELARAIADVDRTYFPAAANAPFTVFLVARPDRYLRGSDHLSFNHEGFAAVRFTEWREDFHHQHQNVVIPPKDSTDPVLGDLPEFVDFNYAANVARLNAAALATLASSPGIPVKLTLENKKLENDSSLTWLPPAGATAATQYEVLWRETTSFDWQFSMLVKVPAKWSVGDPITATVPASKDNIIFGVRTIDAAGHRSLVVVPQ